MSTKGMQWLMPKAAQNKPAYQAQDESIQESFLPRSIAAKDWLLGVLAFLALMGVTAGVGRLFMGLKDATSLSDGVSWGIWIGFDFGLIAFAGAGFTMAAVVHIFHLEQFHKALRPALLVGLLGYMAVLALLVLDLGRWDRFYHFLLYFNLHSPLFEISWCVLLYSTVLMIEVSPDFLRFLPWKWPARTAAAIIVPVSIIGVTLSTLHQSTLGTLYLNMPYRLHPLWYTPILPILFYVSSIMAGLSLGILAYLAACKLRNVPVEARIGAGLGNGLMWVAVVYAVLKVAELTWANEWALLGDGAYGLLWGTEMIVGVLLPIVLLSKAAWRRNVRVQVAAPLLVLSGVLLNRFDATLFGQILPKGAAYSPHIMEWMSTIGILAAAALAWMICVRFVVRDEEHAH
jgi:Ni/Fe-hydrogenase subunit HybB-like protein